MPIRAEYRKYYDARWRKFRLTMLEAAGIVCQICHQPHRLLNVVHLSHDPADRTRLTVLCPRCHSKNNAAQRIAMARRTRARLAVFRNQPTEDTHGGADASARRARGGHRHSDTS